MCVCVYVCVCAATVKQVCVALVILGGGGH